MSSSHSRTRAMLPASAPGGAGAGRGSVYADLVKLGGAGPALAGGWHAARAPAVAADVVAAPAEPARLRREPGSRRATRGRPASARPRLAATPPTRVAVQQGQPDVVSHGKVGCQHLVLELHRLRQLARPPTGTEGAAVGRALHSAGEGPGAAGGGAVVLQRMQRHRWPAREEAGRRGQGCTSRRAQCAGGAHAMLRPRQPQPPPAASCCPAHIRRDAAPLHLLKKEERIPQLAALHARKQACGAGGRRRGQVAHREAAAHAAGAAAGAGGAAGCGQPGHGAHFPPAHPSTGCGGLAARR